MICGPKSSGKSTFAKLLINRLVTSGMPVFEQTTAASVKPRTSDVAFLDIDPGQPEYSPPGQLSLIYITEPNFGPPYSHPDASNAKRECIRAHSIASNSPATDTALYMACVIDLLSHYRGLSLEKKCSLVINTPGWVLGTGLELLVELIREARPTDIIYMSQEGPSNVVQSLKDAAGSIPFVMLPSQRTELTTWTAAHLRSMQVMSYLHLCSERQERETWDPRPLVSIPPLVVKYAGNNAGIFGVMCLGEQPPAEMIIDTINGTLVAVVVMDDITAILGLRKNILNPGSDSHPDRVRFDDWKINHTEATESELPILDNQEEQVIIRTPELIPYFNPKIAISLDPRYSHAIGLALIRGVDVKRRRFHLLSPISSCIIENITSCGKLIVLVSGKLDTPGWAYTEHLYKRAVVEKGGKIQTTKLSNDDEEDSRDARDSTDLDSQGELGANFECAPWIERMQGDQGRGAGARVWRVRRDLGKSVSD
jgi:polynucleotide 5'-hydroxyl-kinase GRC3/NOL9